MDRHRRGVRRRHRRDAARPDAEPADRRRRRFRFASDAGYLAASGAQLPLLTLAVSVESFASGFAGAALIAYMSSLVSPVFAATQYALLSSLYALPGKFVGGLSGVMVDAFGYVKFFIATATIGIPVVALTLIVWRLARRGSQEQSA